MGSERLLVLLGWSFQVVGECEHNLHWLCETKCNRNFAWLEWAFVLYAVIMVIMIVGSNLSDEVCRCLFARG